MTGNLSLADVSDIQSEFRTLMDDVQALQNVTTITIKRGGTTVLAVRPKSLRLDNQQADNGSATGPRSDVTQGGTVKIATTEYTAEVRVGDRFIWQGQPCMVSTSPMEKPLTGMTEFAFTMTARDRGV